MGDVRFSPIKSVFWLTVSLSAGSPSVFAHSVHDKWGFSEEAFLREGKYLPLLIFFFLKCSGFLRKGYNYLFLSCSNSMERVTTLGNKRAE